MGLIDVVKKAQSLGPADAPDAGVCALEPTWLIGEQAPAAAGEGYDDLVSWRAIPSVADSIKLRIEKEEQFVSELGQKADDALSPNKLDGLLRPYLEQVLNPNPNPSVHIASERSGGTHASLPKLLKKASPRLGQKLLSSTLRACFTSRYWDAVKAMLDSHALNGNTHSDFIPTLIEHDQASLLCMWVRNVHDPRFSDLLLVLKYFLKSSLRAGKSLAVVRHQWRQAALVGIAKVSQMGVGKKNHVDEDGGGGSNVDVVGNGSCLIKKVVSKEVLTSKAILLGAAVDQFQPFELCLHYLVASGHDEAVLASILSRLDGCEVFKLLHYLEKWLEKYSKQGALCTSQATGKDLWVPSLREVLQWLSIILDVHLMTLILCSDFHGELRSIQLLVKGLVDVGHKFAPLVGVTDHLRTNGLLPTKSSSHRDDDHVIEYLEI